MEQNFSNEEKRVEQLLTPKHAPGCNVQFAIPRKKRVFDLWRCVRIAGVAAMFAVVAMIGFKGVVGEEAMAAPSMNERIEKALQQFMEQNSMLVEYRTRERINIGLQQKSDTSMINCRLIFLRDDSTIYMREECGDEYNTVAIYDKDSLHLWQNGRLQKSHKIVRGTRVERYEYLFVNSGLLSNFKENVDGNSRYFIDSSDIKSITVLKSKNMIIVETEPFEGVPCSLFFRCDGDDAQLEKFLYGNSDAPYMESTCIRHNYPITKEEILRAPGY